MRIGYLIVLVFFYVNSSLSSTDIDCLYVAKQTKDNRYPELSAHSKCGYLIGQDNFSLSEFHFNNLYFDKNGLASIIFDGVIFYVSKNGKVVRTHFFDNGADYFVEGVARTIAADKFGFIDKGLNVAIKPEYDFAFPFRGGVAVVCNACFSVVEGEHKNVVGGEWGLINRAGKIVVPVKYKKNELVKSDEYKRATTASGQAK